MQGLDDLADRARHHKAKGCDFAKWRMVIEVDEEKGKPSELAIKTGAQHMALYATICQVRRILL